MWARIVAPIAAAVALLAGADGQYVTPAGWTEAGICGPDSTDFRWTIDGGFDMISTLADHGTRVMLCNGADRCVTSQPNAFPIINLRNGLSVLSHIGGEFGQGCGAACVQRFWTGPADLLAHLQVGGQAFNPTAIYHASNNVNGLHVHRGICTWVYNNRGSPNNVFRVLIDFSGTFRPTSAPTTAPTDWFQDPGHFVNITQAQQEIVAMSGRLRSLEALVATKASQSSIDDIMTRLELVNEMMFNQEANLHANITNVSARVDMLEDRVFELRSALKNAVADAVGGNPVAVTNPQVVSAGPNIELVAPGTVSLRSGSCEVDDACSTSAFAERLKNALNLLAE